MSTTTDTADAGPYPTSTADTLLDTAELLFATHGIESVSLRRIAAECGHGNRSGALYHFGSREALIRRVLERRMEVVDKIRHAKLDKVLNDGRENEVAAIVAAAVQVLVDVVGSYPWGRNYVVVISQAMFDPKIQFFTTIDARAVSGISRTTAMLRRLTPAIPNENFDKRMAIFYNETVYVFARWLQAHGQPTKANQASFQTMMDSVTEFMAGGIMAPVLSIAKLSGRRGS